MNCYDPCKNELIFDQHADILKARITKSKSLRNSHSSIDMKSTAHRELRDLNRAAKLTLIQKATEAAVFKSFSCQDDPTGARRSEQIKHAVKNALQRNYSSGFAHDVVVTASLKFFKKEAIVLIQAAVRGYLVRKNNTC